MKFRPTRQACGAVAATLALTLVLAGCQSSGSGDGSGGEESGGSTGSVGEYRNGLINVEEGGDPQRGGTLTFGAYSEPATLDPGQTIVSGSTGGNEMAAIYDVLMRYDEESGEIVPQLAESLESSEDAQTWTLTLRGDVDFSDGTPLDAEAVVASIERYVEAGGDDAAIWELNVDQMSVEDDRTVVFELNKPWPTFDFLFTLGVGQIVAEASDQGEEFTPIGAGPYVFESRSPQESVVLSANPDYWQGEPMISELTFSYLNDPSVIYDSFTSDAIDMAFVRDAEVVEEALNEETSGYLQMLSLGTMAIINAEEGRPGSDVRVRRAIQLAIDPEVVAERTTGGAGVASSDLFPELSKWHSTQERGLPHDPDQASELVAEAKADGFDGKITYLASGSPSGRETGVAYKASLDAVGFDTTVDVATSVTDVVNAVAIEGTYDMSTWAFSWREDGPFARMFATSSSKGNLGAGSATSPELDDLIDQVQQAENDEEKAEVMADIQAEWNEIVPALVLGPTAELTMWRPDVHGVKTDTNTIVLFDQAWIG